MPTDRALLSAQKHNDAMPDDAEEEPEEPVKALEKQATFDEFTVWAHEAVPAADDPFVKGVEEWLKLAEAVCEQTLVLNGKAFRLIVWLRCIRVLRLRRKLRRKLLLDFRSIAWL